MFEKYQKDSGVFGHGVKPYTGIPLEMSMEAHQGLFAANGTASAIFAYKVDNIYAPEYDSGIKFDDN